MADKKKDEGLWEWVGWYSSWCKGCKNNCKYCYAMLKLVCRLKLLPDYESFADFKLKTPTITLRDGKTTTKIRKLEGWGMLPGTHDIFPEILDETLSYFRKHLEIGNKLLIVSKPHFECIKAIIKEFSEFKEQIHFRFTITSDDDPLIEEWEPFAPLYHERIDSLMYANQKKVHTSISIGPFLDRSPLLLINSIEKFAQEIWIEPMNHLVHIKKIVDSSEYEYARDITSIKRFLCERHLGSFKKL